MASGLQLLLDIALCVGSLCPPDPETGLSGPKNATENYEMEDLSHPKATNKEILQLLRNTINGTHLKVATLEDYPLSYTETKNGKLEGKGVSFALIDFLAEKYNFTYDVLKPPENKIGSSSDFENSLIEMVNKSQVDLAAAFVPLLADPRNFTFYSTTALDEGEWIMVMTRPKESATGSGLLAPFDKWVWVLIFVSLLCVGPIIYALILLRNKLTGDDSQKPYSLGHCAWFVYGALLKQGSTLSPIADSTRLLFATWWIFITILTSFYTANLTAFLTLSKFTLPFNTVNDILKAQKQFVTARGGGVEYAIKNNQEQLSMLKPLVDKNIAQFISSNDKDILKDYVEQKGFVFVRDKPAMDILLHRDYMVRKDLSKDNERIHCPFAVAKNAFMTKKRGFVYPIGSNISKLFDAELLNLVELGIVKHLTSAKVPNAEICPLNLGGTERQLRITDLMMTFYIMIVGFATSIVIFGTELFFKFINAKNIKQDEWQLNPGLKRNKQYDWTNMRDKMKNNFGNYNITPPPPYASIYSGNNTSSSTITNLSNQPNYSNQLHGVKRLINGRDYLVFKNKNGESQLIPVRAPSATLFQYSYTE